MAKTQSNQASQTIGSYPFYKCKKCGDEIFAKTHKKYMECSCGALAVDGCDEYVRLIGKEEDREMINKEMS